MIKTNYIMTGSGIFYHLGMQSFLKRFIVPKTRKYSLKNSSKHIILT